MTILQHQIEALFAAIQTLTRVLKGAEAQGLADAAEHLSPSEVMALMHVGARPRSIQSELAETLSISATTASSIVDRLEKKGLVSRARTQANRRVVELNLTAKGHDLHRQVVEQQLGHCRMMLKVLSPAQRAQFVELMQTIADSLDSKEPPRRP